MNPRELANLAHLRRARDLIDRPYVTDACMEVGSTSLGSFSSRFTEIVGMTPSAYRAREHHAVKAMPTCIARQHTRPARKLSRIEEASPSRCHIERQELLTKCSSNPGARAAMRSATRRQHARINRG
ncbi:hypothetical protein DAD99_04870 [Pseudarthrobacter sp. AB1]|nr:hypothetical protein [Pseudarthrobacter sp. AB1]